jgi:hypothetical protein
MPVKAIALLKVTDGQKELISVTTPEASALPAP